MRQSVAPSSLAGEAYDVVRQRIVRGHVGLGQSISRRKLAAELGMSFLPVSMAFLRLEHEGFIESRPRAGTRVRIPSKDDVRGHYVVREALEVQAAKLFTSVATEREREELKTLAARVDALAWQTNRREQYVRAHLRLHRRVADCARCPTLSATIEQTNALASIWFCVIRRPLATASTRRHEDLMDVLCAGDGDRAAEAMRQHIAVGMDHTMEALAPYFKMRRATGRTYARSAKFA